MKKIILTLLLLISTLFAMHVSDMRLLNYPQARPWLVDGDTNGASANNIGVLYYKTIKDTPKAIVWFKKAYKMNDKKSAGSAANSLGYIYENLEEYKKAEEWNKKSIEKGDKDAAANLGLLYKKLHKYDDAILYYKKAYTMGNIGGANALGYLYNVILKEPKKALKWYKIAAKGGDADGINNLGRFYHAKGDKITSSAYILAMVNYGYTKEEVFNFLKNDWKIDKATIKKAYQLQKTLDIPKHYYDSEFENK